MSEAVLLVEVADADGTVLLAEEVALPADRAVVTGKRALGLYAARFDGTRAVLELVAGRSVDGRPKPRWQESHELDPFAPFEGTVTYKDASWRVRATLGERWSPPAPVPAAETPSRYVLAWDDAVLLASPRDPRSAKRERELPARADAVATASPMKVVDTWGATHLEIETVPDALAAHCQAGAPPSEPFPLQYYVARTDLVPLVTAREVRGELPDGTGYLVAAGVPVEPRPDGTARVRTGGLAFDVRLGEGDTDQAYRPTARFPVGEAPLSLAPGTVGRTGLGAVAWEGPDRVPVAGLSGVREPIATVRVPCAEVRMHVDPVLLRP